MKKDNCYIVTLLDCYLVRSLSLLLTIIFVSLLTSHFSPSIYALEPEAWSGKCVENVPGVGKVATLQGFECIFRNVVRVLTPIAGLAVFIMLIVGSFQLITAGGEAKQVQKAQKTFTSAIIGLVALIGIWFILKLIETITGVEVTKFEVPK